VSGEHRKGVVYSASLHLLILLLGIFGLPAFLQPTIPPQPIVISVDILPITEMTNVKNSDLPLAKEEKPEPQKEEAKPTPPVKAEPPPPPPEPKPPEPKKAETPPPPLEPKAEPKPEPKPEPKKEEAKPEPPKEKPKKTKEEELDQLLKTLREDAKKEKPKEASPAKKPAEDAGSKTKSDAPYDASQPMSMTELDAIRSQIAKCWSVPAGAKNAENLQVTLRVQLAQDGTVMLVELADESKARYGSDTFYRAASDSAMRAVRQCSPLQNLPPEKYQTWRDIIMTFDPKEMLF